MSGENQRVREYQSPDGSLRCTFELGPDGILRCSAMGHQTLETAQRIMSILGEYRDLTGRPLRLLLDATGLSRSDPEARSFMDQGLRSGSQLRAFAVVGGKPFSRTLYNLYARIAEIPMQVVKDEAEGVEFLSRQLADWSGSPRARRSVD